MDLVELTSFLVKSLVKDPEMVSVKQFEDDTDTITIQVLVDNEEIGAVIGKNGAIANSIRTLVQASSYANGLKKVKINIDSF
ncbi:MAG: KH domain-containing protein [Firmicutes bacterium]|nr:KH domain-containing protein [Bacillota bacterium]